MNEMSKGVESWEEDQENTPTTYSTGGDDNKTQFDGQ